MRNTPLHPASAWRAALAAALVAAALPASGAELDVSPILIELGGATTTALVTVRNAGAESVRLQLRAYRWDQDDRGQMELSPAPEVVVYPPLLELPPGASRNVRLGADLRPGDAEGAFRLFLEELPAPPGPAGQNQVRVLTRVGIPVFVAPKVTRHAADVEGEATGSGAEFRLLNGGSVRLRPSAVRVELLAADGRPLVSREESAWYVLAGGVRRYTVDATGLPCGTAGTATLTAEVDARRLTSSVRVEGPACRR
ncbi:MAG: fimbria/pilus periplasmic chaperone [Anaeromyxobacteraceae bacterium]|nr:fimbria/pilus periplasmic chaperone [Anaeromyxobacteraceae bacterium]